MFRRRDATSRRVARLIERNVVVARAAKTNGWCFETGADEALVVVGGGLAPFRAPDEDDDDDDEEEEEEEEFATTVSAPFSLRCGCCRSCRCR